MGRAFIIAKSFAQGKDPGKKGSDNAEPEKDSQKENESSEARQGSFQGSDAFFESIFKGSEGRLWMTIEELTTTDLVTVNEDASIEEVFSIFAKNPYHTLPIIN